MEADRQSDGEIIQSGLGCPPGNLVMWRGLPKLNDIHLGFWVAAELVG